MYLALVPRSAHWLLRHSHAITESVCVGVRWTCKQLGESQATFQCHLMNPPREVFTLAQVRSQQSQDVSDHCEVTRHLRLLSVANTG